jgi:regulator of sigma E protease
MIFAAQLLLSLSLLIILHEAGHFIPAKLFKIRVEKFYLFFDPWFSLVKKKFRGTEYGIGWLPLGGYVKISGMVDESMDKEQMAKPAEPWEFRAKPAWQRLIVMIGGVTVNVIVGIVIYSMILWTHGDKQLPVANVTNGVHCNPIMYQFGFEDGDKILALDGVVQEDFFDINKRMILDDPKTVQIERNGKLMDITLPDSFGQLLIDSGVKSGCFAPRQPFILAQVVEDKPAAQAGLKVGDRLMAVNGKGTGFFNDIAKEIKASANQTVELTVLRNGQEMKVPVAVTEEGTIGVANTLPSEAFVLTTKEYTLLQAIPGGFKEAWETVTDYGSQLRFLFSKAGATQVGGFVTFAKLFPAEWDWLAFWERTALISLILAFMNILPIPALDGGHIMFLLWEMITGKAVNQKVLESTQVIGMVLLLGLMLYGNGMDIFRLVTGK